LLTKGTVNEWVVSFLKTIQTSKPELLRLLFSFQNRKLIPIAPFHFQNGELKSELIDIVISDLTELLCLTEKDDNLHLTRKAMSTFPITYKLDRHEIENLPTDLQVIDWKATSKFMVKEKSFDCNFMALQEVLDFVKTLPNHVEIGAQFSVHEKNPMFKSAVPLAQCGKKYCALVERSPKEFQIRHFNRNYRRLKSFTYNLLGSSFDEKSFENSLELIYYNLLPASILRVDSICKEGHPNRNYHERYVDGILAPERVHCVKEECFSSIERIGFVVSNERIFNAWKNGVLMEWFAASILRESGLDQALWNIELSGIQCDVLALWDDEVVVIECKRTDKYGDTYKEGVKHLKEINRFFETNEISTHTILMTTVQGVPKKDEGIDIVITQDNFLDFCQDPISLL
jgi:hypothetical protein